MRVTPGLNRQRPRYSSPTLPPTHPFVAVHFTTILRWLRKLSWKRGCCSPGSAWRSKPARCAASSKGRRSPRHLVVEHEHRARRPCTLDQRALHAPAQAVVMEHVELHEHRSPGPRPRGCCRVAWPSIAQLRAARVRAMPESCRIAEHRRPVLDRHRPGIEVAPHRQQVTSISPLRCAYAPSMPSNLLRPKTVGGQRDERKRHQRHRPRDGALRGPRPS